MDETTLRAILRSEKALAMGSESSQGSELAGQRSSAMEYYLGEMDADMPTLEGRSSAVSTDVADTVDGIMPSLMDIFTSSDEVVKFDALGPEDEDAAAQETDYCNHVFYVDNPGFVILHSMVKDALIQKNGIVKFWWDEGEEEVRESYRSLTPDAYALLIADESVEVIEHEEAKGLPAPDGRIFRLPDKAADVYGDAGEPAGPIVPLHDVVVICRKPYGKVSCMPVPPEEFLIARDAKDIRTARYTAHKVVRTRSELVEQGYSRAQVDELPTGVTTPTIEQASRSTVDDDISTGTLDTVNKAMQQIEVTEHYLRVDWDEDGIAELRKVTTAGTGETILKFTDGKPDNEEVDRHPFASITPIMMSHRFWGRSVADLVMDIQKIKTALMRAVLDNAYFANNQRMEVAESLSTENTLDDLLTNRPGGIVRTKAPGGVVPIPTNPIGQHLFPVLEYMDQTRETRTGVQRQVVGPDADTLNPYKQTATGVNALQNAAQARIRLIARTFAETGIKDMMLGIHELILKHGTEARKVKLRQKWVTVDPREWKTRKDMSVLVGLGTGTRDQQQAYLMQMLGVQTQAIQMQGGASGPLVTLTNVYNTVRKLTENAGFRSVDPYFTEPPLPQAMPPQPPKPDPKMVEAQGKLQIAGQKAQAQVQTQQAKAMGDHMLAQQQQKQDFIGDQLKLQSQAQLEQFKAILHEQSQQSIAQMKAHSEAVIALLRPNEKLRPGGALDA